MASLNANIESAHIEGGGGVCLTFEENANLINSAIQGKFEIGAGTLNCSRTLFNMHGNSPIFAKCFNFRDSNFIFGDRDITISSKGNKLSGRIDVTGRAILEAYNQNCTSSMNINAQELIVKCPGNFQNIGPTKINALKVEKILGSFEDTYGEKIKFRPRKIENNID